MAALQLLTVPVRKKLSVCNVSGAKWEMDRMSDYDIRRKAKVCTGAPNECRTFGRTLYASVNVFYW